MSVTGSAAAKKILRGKLSSCEMIYIDAYELAVINGFEGTIEEWLASMKGDPGKDGQTPQKGIDYFTDADKAEFMGKVWSTFTKSGATVTCESIEGYPLGVVSKIEPIQAGSGDASPDNVRSISGHSSVKLTRNDEKFTLDLGQKVYGGSLDWKSGVLTIDRALYTFDGKESYTALTCKGSTKKRYRLNWDTYGERLLKKVKFSNNKLLFSKLPTIDAGDTYYMVDGIGIGTSSSNTIWIYCEQYATDLDGFKQMMKGAQLVFELAEPIAIQLTPKVINALSVVNTLHSDTGDTEVTGVAYLTPIIEDLTKKVSELDAYNNETLPQEEKKKACQRIGTINVVENSNGTITVTMPSGKKKTVDLSWIEKLL